MSWLVAVLGLAFLVLIHEAGHFFAARSLGMRPRRFYLGFPPAVAKVNRGGIEYGIGAIPLGGYVKIPGMHRPAPSDLDAHLSRAVHEAPELTGSVERMKRRLERGEFTEGVELAALEASVKGVDLTPQARRSAERGLSELRDGLGDDAYWRAGTWKRVAVIFAGPGTNLVFAIVLLAIVFAFGVRVATLNVSEVQPGSPADLAGLRAGDRVVGVDGQRVGEFNEVYDAVQQAEGTPMTLVVDRAGRTRVIHVTPTHYFGQNWAIGFRPGARVGALLARRGDRALVRQDVGGDEGDRHRLLAARHAGRSARHLQPGRHHARVEPGRRRGLSRLPAAARVHQPVARSAQPAPAAPARRRAHRLLDRRGPARPRRRTRGLRAGSVIGIALVLMLFFIGLSNDLGGNGPG